LITLSSHPRVRGSERVLIWTQFWTQTLRYEPKRGEQGRDETLAEAAQPVHGTGRFRIGRSGDDDGRLVWARIRRASEALQALRRGRLN
jgi:hypothetical protein